MREINPQADEALRRMCTTLDRASALRFHVTAVMDGRVETGQLAQFHRTSDITLARPDRMYVRTETDDGGWTAWYQKRSLTLLDTDENLYATEAVPNRIDQMLDYLADEYDVIMPMADLLVGKSYESLVENVEQGLYVGLHTVDDTPCHHLLFMQPNLDWQIWIDAGALPVPRKLVITYTLEPDQPQYVATMKGWDLAPGISEETFAFVPPARSRSVPMADLVLQD